MVPLDLLVAHTPVVPNIELVEVRKSFAGVPAVDGIDLCVETGEVVALLGPNGAGKSTTFDLLLGLVPPDRGGVHLFDGPPARACAEGRVGAMLQNGGLLGRLTVRELVELMRGISRAPLPLDEVLAVSEVTSVADTRADRLSGGESQRVRFALAIAGDPDLLVLDEPTVAMDVVRRRAFWAFLQQWSRRGRTVLFATHYLDEADTHADRVVLMARGRIVADGSPAQIRADAGGGTLEEVFLGLACTDEPQS